MTADTGRIVGEALLLLGGSALVTAGLLELLHPLLRRYALARPNARSSHREPTPQGAGIAVILATIVAVVGVTYFAPAVAHDASRLAIVFAAAIGLALVGATDDIRPLEALPRLALQAVAVAAVIWTLPAELRVLPQLPWGVERSILLLGTVWFVNLTNFMDGIDWITAAEAVPVTAMLALFGLTGELPGNGTIVAIALCGALIGFAPFNKPVARIFLGDVGSLPIGLLLAWLLALLAERHLAAALLLPLYYLADASITLVWRLSKGERITQAHRSHYYQRATENGFSVMAIVARIFGLNIALALLAWATILMPSRPLHIAIVAIGCALVSLLLYRFARRR